MTYHEIVKRIQEAYKNVDASKVEEHIAIQFNITGEGEGAFYMEVKDGNVYVEPYDYFDRDVLVTASAAELLKVLEGELDLVAAYTTGRIKAEGNLGKVLKMKEFIPNKKNVKKEEAVVEEVQAAPAEAEEPKAEEAAPAEAEEKAQQKKPIGKNRSRAAAKAKRNRKSK